MRCAREFWKQVMIPQTRRERMIASLQAAFDPLALQVSDDSAQHAGHAGAAAGGETHYTIEMTTRAFSGKTRLARSRAVHEALAAEFRSGLHALALTLRAPTD